MPGSDWASTQYGSEVKYTASQLNQISKQIADGLQNDPVTGGKKKSTKKTSKPVKAVKAVAKAPVKAAKALVKKVKDLVAKKPKAKKPKSKKTSSK